MPGAGLGYCRCGAALEIVKCRETHAKMLRCIRCDMKEALAQTYIRESGKARHLSTCATSNAPDGPVGPCDCEYGWSDCG